MHVITIYFLCGDHFVGMDFAFHKMWPASVLFVCERQPQSKAAEISLATLRMGNIRKKHSQCISIYEHPMDGGGGP